MILKLSGHYLPFPYGVYFKRLSHLQIPKWDLKCFWKPYSTHRRGASYICIVITFYPVYNMNLHDFSQLCGSTLIFHYRRKDFAFPPAEASSSSHLSRINISFMWPWVHETDSNEIWQHFHSLVSTPDERHLIIHEQVPFVGNSLIPWDLTAFWHLLQLLQ